MPGPIVGLSAHGDKDVREWLRPLIKEGWVLRKEGHGYRLYCSCKPCSCTKITIPSTPGNKRRLKEKIKVESGRCPLDQTDPRRDL